MDRVNHIIHGWVVSHEVDNLVWIILCGFHVWGESPPRTLFKKRERGQSCNYDLDSKHGFKPFVLTVPGRG